MLKMDFIHSDDHYSTNLCNKVMVVFGGSYGIGQEIATLAEKYGCKVYRFSRTTTESDVSVVSDVRIPPPY